MKGKRIILYVLLYILMVGLMYIGFCYIDKRYIRLIRPDDRSMLFATALGIPLFIIIRIEIARAKNRTSLLTPEKRKAMYPPVPKKYLSKKPDGLILGKYGSSYVRVPLDLNNVLHAAIVGSPGSGKSSLYLSILLSNFMQHPPPMQVFCIDVKPELARKSVEIYNNPHVRVVNPTDRSSWGWNAFYDLNDNSSEDEIARVVDGISRALIVIENKKNSFFSNSARNIFTGLVIYYYIKGFGFVECVLLIMSKDVQGQIQDALEDNEICSESSRIRQYLSEYAEADSEALNDIKMTLKENLNIFTDADVIWNLRDNPRKASPMDFEEDMSIFISVPESFIDYGSTLLRLYTHQVLEYCEKYRNETSKMLAIILEELPRIGRLDRLKNALGTFRSRRISILFAIQDASQLQSIYSYEEARTLLNLAEIHVVCSCNDVPTIDTYSKWAGEYRQVRQSTSRGHQSNSISISYENKKIIEPSDMMTLRRTNEVILFIEGRYYRVKKCQYFKDRILNRRYKQICQINERR